MIDHAREAELLGVAAANLANAKEAMMAVSRMHWGSDKALVGMVQNIGSILEDVLTYGQPPSE